MAVWCPARLPAGSTRLAIKRSGRRPGITVGAGSRFPASSIAAALRCCRRARGGGESRGPGAGGTRPKEPLRTPRSEANPKGIGDKHVHYIHNVMNTDIVVGVSDRSTGALDLLFNSETGSAYLSDRRHIDPEAIAALKQLGLSGIANLVAAIKTAKRLELGEDDVLVTVATDSAGLYGSEH